MDKNFTSYLSWKIVVVALSSSTIFLLIYFLRLNQVIGEFKDDAWYLLLAQSIATGQGYKLVNFPLEGITPFYPPGFPLALSIVCKVYPQFPENIYTLKLISIASMFFLGIMLYHYFHKYKNIPQLLSLSIALITVISPAYVFLATSTLMSECFYSTIQMAAILAIERYSKQNAVQKNIKTILLIAAIVSFTFLVRSAGIAIIISVVFFLVTKRYWLSTITLIIGITLFLSPWFIYKAIHFKQASNPLVERQYPAKDYFQQFLEIKAGSGGQKVDLVDIPKRTFENIKQIVELNVGGMFLPIIFRQAQQSGEETLGMAGDMNGNGLTKLFSCLLTILIVLGFLLSCRLKISFLEILVVMSLLLTIVWPWLPFRLVLPIFPFLIFYLTIALQYIHKLVLNKLKPSRNYINNDWLLVGVVTFCIIIFNLYDHIKYLQLQKSSLTNNEANWVKLHDAHLKMFQIIKDKTPQNSVISTDNPAIVFLYTSRLTVVSREEDFAKLRVKYIVKTEIGVPSSNIIGKKLLYLDPDLYLMVLGTETP